MNFWQLGYGLLLLAAFIIILCMGLKISFEHFLKAIIREITTESGRFCLLGSVLVVIFLLLLSMEPIWFTTISKTIFPGQDIQSAHATPLNINLAVISLVSLVAVNVFILALFAKNDQ